MFDFSKFFDIGEELMKVNDEAHNRSSISRFYYSIFCSSRQYLVETKNQYYFLNNKDIHKKLADIVTLLINGSSFIYD